MNWLTNHLSLISTLVSVCTLLVWIFYAHILAKGFRRSERPLILIHQAGGHGRGSSCLVVNLSRQPLHVVTVHLVVRTEGHEITLRLNEYQRITNDDEADWAVEDVMKEGPLRSGEFLSLGGFKSMLDGARDNEDKSEETRAARNRKLAERAHEFEIRVSAVFSSFDNPIGATRRFSVTLDGDEVRLMPKTPITRQMSTYRQRKQVYQWLRES